MRHLTFHHLFRQGGVCALFLVSALPLAAQTRPASAPSQSVEVDARLLVNRSQTIQTVEQEIKQIEMRMKARAAAKPDKKSEKSDPERKRLNWLRSYLYRMTLLANDNGVVDWAAIERGRAQRDKMQSAPRSISPKAAGGIGVMAFPTGGINDIVIDPLPGDPNAGRWTFIGPKNMASPSRWAFGPDAANGRINGVAFDPNRAGTFYIAAPLGGAWKTVDRGKTWTPLMDSMPGLGATAVTVDPNNSNIVYVGTGDYDGGDGAGFGLLKSTNGGTTWTRLGAAQFGSQSIRKVWVDPNNSQHLLVTGAGAGLFRSTDGGLSFANIFPADGLVSNVAYNTTRSVLYASVDRVFPFSSPGIYRSTDNGQNWTRVLDNGGGRMDVATSQVNPNVAYALDAGSRSVYKTEDGGDNWANTTNNLPRSEWSQSFYDFYLACSRNGDTDVLWVGLLDIMVSKDAGNTWQPVGNVYTDVALTHTDQHAIGFNPKNPGDILVGNDGGVYRLTFSPGDDYIRFESLNANLGVTQFYGLDIHPTRDTYVMGGTQDNATPRAPFNILNWDNPGTGDGGHSFINPLTVANQYNTSQSYVDAAGEDWLSMRRTDNTWASAVSIDTSTIEGPLFITAEAMDRTRPQFLFAGGSNVVRYDSSGSATGTWTQTDDDLNAPVFTDGLSPAFPDYPGPIGSVSAMGVSRGVDAADPKLVLAGTTRGGVFFSNEDGQNFHRIDLRHRRAMDGTPSFVSLLPSRAVTSIQGSIFNNNQAYITMGGTGGGHIYRCDGLSGPFSVRWTDISGVGPGRLPDVPAYTLAILPYEQGRRMYVGTEVGVFFSEDGGTNWTNATTPLGLPNVRVTRLEFNPSTGTLTAATYGRGMWQVQAGNNVLMQLNLVLQYYRGSKTRLNAKVEIFIPGQDLPAFQPIETKSGALTVAGYFFKNVSSRGTFDVYVTVPRFLRKLVAQVSIISGRPVATGTMYCGDVNGDNVINATDVNAVRNAMGRYTTGPVDLDGDGRVTSRDLSIVQGNVGRQGD